MSHDTFAIAAQTLSTLCDEVAEVEDKGKRISEVLAKTFNDAMLHLESECDLRTAFDRWCKTQLEAAREAYRFYRSRAEGIEEVHEAFKARTVAAMLANPSLPYRGLLGKISCVQNPQGVEYTFGDKHVTEDVIDFYGIPADYVKAKVTYEIDHEKVKAELQEGKEIPWAQLAPAKHHVRFPARRKPKAIEGGGDGD